MSQLSNEELAIYKVGPCGGLGEPFDMNVTNEMNPKLLKITVRTGRAIDCVSVVYRVNGQEITAQFGGNGGDVVETITLGPDEVLTEVNGTFDNDVVRSLTFVTNKKTYGPYGAQYLGIAFYLPAPKDGEIVGFHGRSTSLLNAIGILVKPIILEKPTIPDDWFCRPDGSQPFPTRTFWIANLDAPASSLSVSHGVATMAPSDSSDRNQDWIKDTRYYKSIDKDGYPGFTLMHKLTGKYLLRQGNNLVLAGVEISRLEKTALWTEIPRNLPSGFSVIRALNDTDLVLNYARGRTPSVKLIRATYDSDGNLLVTNGINWKAH